MLIKNIDLVKAVNGLVAFRKECTVTFPVPLAHKINRNIKKLISEVEPYEEDRQLIMSENISDSEKEKKITELLNCETDIQLTPIFLKELSDFNLTINQMDVLDIMLKEDD